MNFRIYSIFMSYFIAFMNKMIYNSLLFLYDENQNGKFTWSNWKQRQTMKKRRKNKDQMNKTTE